MLTTHTTELRCQCPIDDRADFYHVEITLDRVIMVEDIRKVLALHTDKKAIQEEVTASITGYLGARVVTHGQHSEFQTRCEVDRLPIPPCKRPGTGDNQE